MLKQINDNNASVRPNSDLLDKLQQHFPHFFDKDGNFNIEKFSAELKENNITEARDGYRLSFVGKDYARLQTGRASETLITPDADHNAKPENLSSQNIFITGDNLEALRHLQNAYRGKVKMIYIDPPYNTGKEFVYNDRFEFDDQKLQTALGYSDEEITRLKSIQGKSSHSAWLTFMYPRLKLAQKLLTDDGVIFVSIDEHECHNLLHLASEIFGEDSFETLIWRKNGKQGNTKKISRFKNTHEFVVVIYRNIYKTTIGKMKLLPNWKGEKTNVDSDYRGNWESGIISLAEEKSDPNSDNYYSITLPSGRMITREFYVSKENFDILRNDNRIYFPKDGDGVPRLKIFEKEEQEYFFDSIIDDMGTFTNAREEIENIFGNREIFDTPKPVKMIKELIRATSLQNSIILDFFTGSATTAHAVMQLNAEDLANGKEANRKFIMVQLDEPTNPESEARKAGYKTIDEISRERIKRAANQLRIKNDELREKQAGELEFDNQENIENHKNQDPDLGFKHYRLATPNAQTIDKIMEFNPNGNKLFSEDMISELGGLETILQTWLIDDGYSFDQQPEEIDFAGYKAHYMDNSLLYIINTNWGKKQTEELLNRVGLNGLNLNTLIVFAYSFDMESLRELELNVKNNLNRQVSIEIRY